MKLTRPTEPHRHGVGASFLVAAVLALATQASGPCAQAATSPKSSVGSGRIVDGGFLAASLRATGGLQAPTPELPAALRLRLLRITAGERPVSPVLAQPKALGDRLTLSLDDGRFAPYSATEEGLLSVNGGAAGANDFIAVRFPMRSLVTRPPFRATDVILGLDNLRGARTWPLVELRVEDAMTPLSPRGGPLVSSVTSFNAVAAGLNPAPVTATAPTDFRRLAVGLPDLDVAATWLSDAAYDDDFDRADEPLSNLDSDWLECVGADCQPAATFADVTGNRVVRRAAGAETLLVKFPALAVDALRPAADLDVVASVQLDLGTPSAVRAGLALRPMANDAFYRVEYVKASDVVLVEAVTPGGVVLLATLPVAVPTDTPLLNVAVEGTNPQVEFTVSVNGSAVGTANDATYRYTGTLVGLSASDTASSGEGWDDLRVQRRPDIYALVQIPPGASPCLPLDVSDGSLISGAISLSSDGATFMQRGTASGCVNPGNPFVQIEVEDTIGDRLFENEAHVVKIDLRCATCPTTRNLCTDDAAMAGGREPVYTAGEATDVVIDWWNEHLSDADGVLFRASLWGASCAAIGSQFAPLAVLQSVVGASPGQITAGPTLLRRNLGSLVPAVEGDYCLVVEELHDSNGDCCPDGEEMTPFPGSACPGACTPTAGSDSNSSTRAVLRDLRVEAPCTPATAAENNLACDSLRVTRDPGELVATHLNWGVVDPLVFPDQYNVFVMEGRRFDPALGFEEVSPLLDRPVGVTSRTYDLVVPGPGRPLWLGVFQADGCPTADSLSDPVPCP